MPPSASTFGARTWLLAVFGAAMMVAAFPTVDAVWPVFLVWPALLARGPELTWRTRLRSGWLMGTLFNIVLFRWIAFTVVEMSGLPFALGAGLVVLYGLTHGLMIGVFFALSEPVRRVATRRFPSLGPLAVAILYVAIEAAWPVLFPWGIGHAFWRVPEVASLQAITGPPGLSFVVMLISALLALAWRRRVHPRVRLRTFVPGAVVALIFIGSGFAWYAHIHAAPVLGTMRVAIIQPNFTLREKKSGDPVARNVYWKRFETLVRSIQPGTADLVLAPEGGFPFLWDAPSGRYSPTKAGGITPGPVRRTNRLKRALREGPAAPAIIGGLRHPPGDPQEEGRTRNSAVHLNRQGVIKGVYDKNILVPFGETMPGRNLFPSLRNAIPGVSDFGPGTEPCRFDVDGLQVGCGICYEAIFSDLIRKGTAGADLQVNLTIDTWFGESTAPWFHLMGHASRAVEFGVPLARAALTGISAVVDVDGRLVTWIPQGQREVRIVPIPRRGLVTPFAHYGPWFRWLSWIFGALLLGLAYGVRRRQRRQVSPQQTIC